MDNIWNKCKNCRHYNNANCQNFIYKEPCGYMQDVNQKMDIETSRGSAKFQTANVIVMQAEIDKLKAENEKLKTRCETIKKIAKRLNGKLQEENKQLKAENEKLKKEKEDYCLICDVADRLRKFVWYATDGRMSYANYTYEAMCNVYDEVLENRIIPYQEEIDELTEKNEKFNQCLEEIKEIAKGINCNGCESTDCNRCYDNFRNKINKKISEVING